MHLLRGENSLNKLKNTLKCSLTQCLGIKIIVFRPQLAWRFIVVSTPLSCATALGLLQPGRGGGQVAT